MFKEVVENFIHIFYSIIREKNQTDYRRSKAPLVILVHVYDQVDHVPQDQLRFTELVRAQQQRKVDLCMIKKINVREDWDGYYSGAIMLENLGRKGIIYRKGILLP